MSTDDSLGMLQTCFDAVAEETAGGRKMKGPGVSGMQEFFGQFRKLTAEEVQQSYAHFGW